MRRPRTRRREAADARTALRPPHRDLRRGRAGHGRRRPGGGQAASARVQAGALSEFSPRLLGLSAEVVARPSYPEKEVALAKDNLVQEVREQRSRPGFLGNERFLKAVFGSHPYAFVAPDEKQV